MNTGYGHPGQGQTSAELRDGRHERAGVMGVGGSDGEDTVRSRGQDIHVPTGTKGVSGENRQDIMGAEEREAESAEGVASEAP